MLNLNYLKLMNMNLNRWAMKPSIKREVWDAFAVISWLRFLVFTLSTMEFVWVASTIVIWKNLYKHNGNNYLSLLFFLLVITLVLLFASRAIHLLYWFQYVDIHANLTSLNNPSYLQRINIQLSCFHRALTRYRDTCPISTMRIFISKLYFQTHFFVVLRPLQLNHELLVKKILGDNCCFGLAT